MSLSDGVLIAGTLDVLVLKALSWGPRHGYGIGRWINENTDAVLAVEEGALYPALHRMERRGWLESRWGRTELDRRAKFYGLSRKGRRQLAEQTNDSPRACDAYSTWKRAVVHPNMKSRLSWTFMWRCVLAS
jgi:transcriptional regulator